MTAPSIGVLLPVRLETRFVAPRARSVAPWQMRLRVVPDAVSITNHDDLASEMELNAVEAMWRAAGGQRLESANGRRAWRNLAAAVGPERAAWLARTFPPVTGARGQITIVRPTQTRTQMRAPRVMGLPPTIEIWIARGGQPPARAATMTVLAQAIDLDLDDPNSTDQPWWTSFPEAVRVGLATEIDLGPVRPTDIEAVYAIGIGGGDPGPLLEAQADSGELGVVAPGAATSTVDGEPAIALGDVDAWRRLVPIGPRAQAGTLAVSSALAGRPVVRGVVGGEADHRPLNGAIVGALWPALWGHSLASVAGFGSRADELGVWAAANLVPEGPLPSMRVGTQPYGLLPATSLRRWTRASGDPAIEDQLVPLVRTLVGAWTAAAERGAAASPPDALRRLLRNPTATRYEWRWMMPTTLAQAVSFRHNEPLPASELGTWWTRRAGQAPRLVEAATPARALISVGWGHDVDLRMVEPEDLPAGTDTGRGLARLATASVAELLAAGPVDGRARASSAWGTSVLTELSRHSLLQSAAVVARTAAGVARPIVEPVSADRRSATEIDTWAARLETTDVSRRRDAASGVRRNVIAGLQALAKASTGDIDRGLRAALDTATHRLDPWATAIAWRRLQALAAAPRTLGIYSWVDAPTPRTTEAGQQYLLAPSTEQAAVVAVLRDRALRDPDADRWQINLTSDAVRSALRLAEEAREGSHPFESLGRMVEAIVVRPIVIDRLRAAFPLIRGLFRRELSIRRVCDGAAVLDAAQNRPGELTPLGVRTAEVRALVDLAVAVDALADLHVAEAALGVVRGRSAAVSAATTSAAGQAVPPIFEVVSTPRDGRVANTVALVVLPVAPAPTGAAPSPAAIADAAVAAYLDARSGRADGPNWSWRTLDAAGQPAGTVSLAQIRLRPCDTVGLARGNLRDVVREVSGAAALDPADAPGHDTVRSLAVALAGVPADSQDAGAPAVQPDPAAAELAGRYLAVRAAAVAAAADARAIAEGTSTEAEQRRALGRIARWGITPLQADVADPVIGGLAARLLRAAESLERRIADAPAGLAGETGPMAAQAIGALVAPEGPYPVYARLPANAFVGVRAEPVSGSVSRLDPDWLETVAPVRPAVARLEAIQLGERLSTGGQPLRAWSSRPSDPWQKVVPPPSDVEVDRPSRLIAAFGPPGVLPPRPIPTTAGMVAVAVIDRFAETVPDTESVAGVAFPHDLPPARAPQAVVLAVPPVVDQELTTDVLIDIVAEVRDLVRTRMADAAEIGAAIDSLHGATLPASGRAAVDLGGR